MKRIILMMVTVLAVAGAGISQKYGHCNFGTLVAAMPGTKQADTDLQAFQQQLVKKGEDMATAFQEKATKYMQDSQSGDYTPKVLAEREQALQKERQEILAYEQELQQKMAEKRDELLKPIVDRVQAAVDKVAKANGFVMIFDTSMFNSVLFAEDATDITELVKAELSIE